MRKGIVIELRELHYFLALVQEQNISRAAKALLPEELLVGMAAVFSTEIAEDK